MVSMAVERLQKGKQYYHRQIFCMLYLAGARLGSNYRRWSGFKWALAQIGNFFPCRFIFKVQKNVRIYTLLQVHTMSALSVSVAENDIYNFD